MKEIKKEWKNLGFASGPLKLLKPEYERSFGCFVTFMDQTVAIGIVFYIGKSFVSFWYLK